MSEYAVLPLSDYTEACEAAREMTGTSDKITSGQLAGKIRAISKGENLDDELENQDDLIEDIMAALQGKAAGDGSGSAPVIRALTVTENGTYTAPGGVDGYSPVVVDVPEPVLDKLVANVNGTYYPVLPFAGYSSVVVDVPIPDVPDSVVQATPVITVSESGLITAKATQEAGAVAAGTKSATKQLTTKGATTITPGPSEQTAVAAGTFVTGDIKVAPVANEDLEAILDEQEELIATLQDTLRHKTEGSGGSNGENNEEPKSNAGFITRDLTECRNHTVTKIGDYAFYDCKSLISVDIPFATSIGTNSFRFCSKLIEADFPLATTIGTYAFHTCTNLSRINLPLVQTVSEAMLRGCSKLTVADFPLVTRIDANAFYTTNELVTLILRSGTMCTLSNTNAFTSSAIASGTGYIYVPRSLLSQYQSATNWSSFSNQFRAIEDYPEICGG